MEPWEYRVEVVKNPEIADVGGTLNRLGSDGWELVSAVSTIKTWVNVSGNDVVLFLKRRGVGAFTPVSDDPSIYL